MIYSYKLESVFLLNYI